MRKIPSLYRTMRFLYLLFLANTATTAVVAFITSPQQSRDIRRNVAGQLSNSTSRKTSASLFEHVPGKRSFESEQPSIRSPNSHLLSYEMSKKIIYNTTLLYALKILVQRYASPSLLSSLHCSLAMGEEQTAGVFTKNILLPLLSSSCCSIQLIINAITGLGCAGFNTLLGPLRSYFMSVLLFSTITSITTRKVDLIRIVFSWIVAVTPEIVHFLNVKRREKLQRRQSINTQQDLQCKLELQISDMGCVACIQKIESTLWNSFPDNIVDAAARLHKDKRGKGGEARIVINCSSAGETEDIIQGIIRKIEESGFNCQLNEKLVSKVN